ncbi:sodium/myo-inositol cotransporter-like [Liolophura sinensis]|uniref:sodium/myo-inositol cotransporter-like n=1 Tax=Liolophura sinensis TaxID=3198878 RepID=UPI00315907C2
MIWLPVGASLFVSNIGSEHFIGLAGSGAARGISVGAWEFNALLLLQLLAWIFVPVYIACGVNLYTGALFIQQSLKWDLYLCILLLILVTAILTITGGLTAVIYTDTLQAFLMVGGALVLMGFCFAEVGGLQGLYEKYPVAETNIIIPNTTCHQTDPQAFKMLRDVDDDYMPWLGFLLGQTPGSIWYWCTDQVIVQRALAAKSLSHAQGAALLAGAIKVLPLFMMVMPGMVSRILYPNEVGCVDPEECWKYCQSRAGCTNIAYPKLVLGLMPVGLRGLMMAVIIAALMSDLDSIFNSASTLFTIDVWKRLRKYASVREQMIVGRIFIVVMTGLAVAWVPVVKETQGGQLFVYIQEITNYLAPPFAMIFLLAILVPRINEKGAFWGLMIALVTGVTRLSLIFIYPAPSGCGVEDNRPSILKDFHYMYFAMLLFGITGISAFLISLATDKPDEELLIRTTYWSRFDKRHLETVDTHDMQFDDLTTTDGVDNPTLDIDTNEKNDTVWKVKDEHGNELKVFKDPHIYYDKSPDVQQQQQQEKADEDVSFCSRVYGFLCGVKEGKVDPEAERQMREHLRRVAELKQDPRAKIGLTVGLVFILGFGISMYIFWSVWRYEP